VLLLGIGEWTAAALGHEVLHLGPGGSAPVA